MKKYNLYITLILGILLCTVSGCKKALNLEPNNNLSDAGFWQTSDQFRLAANEFYTYLITFNQVLYDLNNGGPHSDIRSDIQLQTSFNTFSSGTNSAVVTDVNWNNAFTRLRAINYLLDKATTYAAPAEIAGYVAEAKFFRAYVYFDLLQQFGAVPIVTKPLSIESGELQAPRNSRDEVVDFMIKDLEDAIAVLPVESSITAANKGRISKGAAQAFLGRVGLYEGTWQKFRSGSSARYNALLDKSIANNNAVIKDVSYEIFAPAVLGDSAQKYLFILENEKSNPAGLAKTANKEYILANRYDFSLRQIGQNVTHTYVGAGITRKFVNMYLSQDGLPVEKSPLFKGYSTTRSEFVNRDNRMRYNMMIDSNYYWDNENPGSRINWTNDAADRANSRGRHDPRVGAGYSSQKWGTERRLNDTQEGYDYPVIRLAEVYLNYAEAVFERNGAITDLDLDQSLNKVRNRVNKTMPKLSNGFVTGNGLDMRTEIRRERTIELYFEGFRLDDLKRWKTAETEMPMPTLGVKWTGTLWQRRWNVGNKSVAPFTAPLNVDANGNLIWETGRAWTERNYLYPIPTQQIQLNSSLTQNPGW
jgi:hypothetical protein